MALRHEIQAFLAESGMSASYFGKCAANNSELVARLEAGRDIETRTVERIRAYMAQRREANKQS